MQRYASIGSLWGELKFKGLLLRNGDGSHAAIVMATSRSTGNRLSRAFSQKLEPPSLLSVFCGPCLHACSLIEGACHYST